MRNILIKLILLVVISFCIVMCIFKLNYLTIGYSILFYVKSISIYIIIIIISYLLLRRL